MVKQGWTTSRETRGRGGPDCYQVPSGTIGCIGEVECGPQADAYGRYL